MSAGRPLAGRLRAALCAFDGRAVSLLGEAEAAMGGEPGYADALVALIADDAPMVGSATSWLLKSHLERGGALSAEQTGALLVVLPDEAQGAHWSSALHLAQCVRFLDLGAVEAARLRAWLSPLLTHSRPFVRAWSLDALAHLARHHAPHRAAFADALEAAGHDPAASVRARARRLG